MPKPLLKTSRISLAIAALGVELAATAPNDFRLIPAGSFKSSDGSGRPIECGAWLMSDEDGARLVAEMSARGSARVIDYEHATLHAKKTGASAPAAGWFKQLEWRPGDGLWVIGADWTALAAEQIQGKQYRYISPVFSYDKKTGRVEKLLHAALTNDPGLDGLTDLAALAAEFFLTPNPQENSMNEMLKKLLAALGLAETATEAEALTAVSSLKSDVVALSAQAAAPDPAKFVPVAALTALQGEHVETQTKLAALTAEVEGGKLDKIVADGLACGKLTPATKDWAINLGKKDVAQLTAFIAAAPVVVALGATQTDGKKPEGALDANDSNAVAEAALAYQTEQAGKGINVSTVQAVAHVTSK